MVHFAVDQPALVARHFVVGWIGRSLPSPRVVDVGVVWQQLKQVRSSPPRTRIPVTTMLNDLVDVRWNIFALAGRKFDGITMIWPTPISRPTHAAVRWARYAKCAWNVLYNAPDKVS